MPALCGVVTLQMPYGTPKLCRTFGMSPRPTLLVVVEMYALNVKARILRTASRPNATVKKMSLEDAQAEEH